MSDLTPTQWFDQFTQFIETMTPDWNNEQWCPRHWAPCPVWGANGIAASLELMSVFLNEIAPGGEAPALNAQMHAAGRLCCTLGDERMYELWGKCPPANGGAS